MYQMFGLTTLFHFRINESSPEALILGAGGRGSPPMKILGWQTYRFAPQYFRQLGKFIIYGIMQ